MYIVRPDFTFLDVIASLGIYVINSPSNQFNHFNHTAMITILYHAYIKAIKVIRFKTFHTAIKSALFYRLVGTISHFCFMLLLRQ